MTDHAKTVAQLEAENAVLRTALKSAIYEVSHLSAERGDNRYRPIIARETVNGWRKALASTSSEAADVIEAAKVYAEEWNHPDSQRWSAYETSRMRLLDAVARLAGDTQSKEA